MEEIPIIIEDDWELKGNGLGNVASHQYLPSLFFMKMAKKYNFNISFMVDVAQQLEFLKIKKKNIDIQTQLWKSIVELMKINGFDVQLHIHPQWINSSYIENYFHLTNNWNIALIKNKNIINNSIKYLKDIIKPIDINYKIHSFKAGGWAIQPFNNIVKNLINNDIKIIIGPRKNMKNDLMNINYKNMQEDIYPYYPDYNDINRISSTQKNIFVIPLSHIKINFLELLYSNPINSYINKKHQLETYFKIPSYIKKLKQNKGETIINNIFRKVDTHMKIGNQHYKYLLKTFNITLNKYKKLDKIAPIIFETHTKDFIYNYKNIDKFFNKITKNKNIYFITLTEFYKNRNKYYIRNNN